MELQSVKEAPEQQLRSDSAAHAQGRCLLHDPGQPSPKSTPMQQYSSKEPFYPNLQSWV
jgi:hypothetical protein